MLELHQIYVGDSDSIDEARVPSGLRFTGGIRTSTFVQSYQEDAMLLTGNEIKP